MKISKYFYIGVFSLVFLSSLVAQQAIPLPPSGTQMAIIGDPNNNSDELGHGAVKEVYQMGVYEWTVQDWTGMLNDIAAQPDVVYKVADRHGLWNINMAPWITRSGSSTTGYKYKVVDGAGNLPITNVSLLDCQRACNYTRGKPYLAELAWGTFDHITESGCYTITVAPDGTETGIVSPDAQYYIPSQNQSIKAAFYKGGNDHAGYWLYATQSNVNPGDAASSVLNNKANFNLFPDSPFAPALVLTDVNAFGSVDNAGNYKGTYSAYGCIDMAGNVNEWTTTIDATGNYIVRGGSYASEYYDFAKNYLMRTVIPESFSPDTKSNTIGFRMAQKADIDISTSSIVANNNKTPSSSWQLTTGEEEIGATLVGAAAIGGGIYFVGLDTLLGAGKVVTSAIRPYLPAACGGVVAVEAGATAAEEEVGAAVEQGATVLKGGAEEAVAVVEKEVAAVGEDWEKIESQCPKYATNGSWLAWLSNALK